MTDQDFATSARLNMLEFMVAHLYAALYGEMPKASSDYQLVNALSLLGISNMQHSLDDPDWLATVSRLSETMGKAFVARVIERADLIRELKAQAMQEADATRVC